MRLQHLNLIQYMNFKSISFFFLVCLFVSCSPVFTPSNINYTAYSITGQLPKDSVLSSALQPYKDSVEKNMSQVVGIIDVPLTKKQPEGSLGNFMADALLYMARKEYDTIVDAALINYGGIRIDYLAAGPVTKGRIYELMPFDNIAVLQNVKGSVLQQFLNLMAENGGWPVAGITLKIENKKAVDVSIAGAPLDNEKVYSIALADYTANGGDNATMFKDIPQKNRGYLVRNALIDYINELKEIGKNISVKEEGRVSND